MRKRTYQEKIEDTAKGYLGLAIIFGVGYGIVQAIIWVYDKLVN